MEPNLKGCLERGHTRISERVLSIASPASFSNTLLNLTIFELLSSLSKFSFSGER